MIFADTESAEWKVGPWVSDAHLFYCEAEDHRVKHLILCGGSSLKWRKQEIFSHSRDVERFEWMSREGGARVFSSDESAVHSLSQSALESCDPVF
jgi:hypothetical protein